MIRKKLPSIGARARHLAGDLATVATTPGPKAVSHEEQQRRHTICEGCPYYKKGWCAHSACGCYTRAKTWLAALKCPDGRW